jgi:hypothetical protein
LAIGETGRVSLGGVHDTIRAGAITIGVGDLLSGAGTISGVGGGNNTVLLTNIVNDGTIEATGGSLLVYGSVVGTGEIAVETGATIIMQATVDAGQTMAFSPTAHAMLNDVSAFAGTITGFAKGNILDLASTVGTGAVWSAGTLAIVTATGTIDLSVAGSYAPNDFVVQSDGLGGTEVELACFAAGTRILTPSGPAVVDALSPGDRVLTMAGECLPIRWVGRRKVDCRRHPYPRAVWPVRIKGEAFAPGCPERDLFLSPDHAIYHDGVLIPVKYLLNGITLRQTRARQWWITFIWNCRDTTWCWRRVCRAKRFWIPGTAPRSAMRPARCNCIRISAALMRRCRGMRVATRHCASSVSRWSVCGNT